MCESLDFIDLTQDTEKMVGCYKQRIEHTGSI